MPPAGRDARIALVATRQGGAFSFAQALEHGFPRSTIGRRIRSGAWTRVHPGVYVVAGGQATRARDLWAAWLAAGPGAVISHESAALLHGAERLPLRPITLTNPHGAHHRLAEVFVHQIDDLTDAHTTTRQRLPVSTPARSVVDLGATQDVDTVGRVADDLVRLETTSYAAIGRVLAAITRPGKPGLHVVAAALDERGDGFVPPASELERALFAALDAGGLDAPERQIPLPGRGRIAGIADAGYRRAQVILEADGRRWHARVEAARRDRERDAQVVRAGWVPLRFLYEHIVGDPAGMCAVVSDTLHTRLRQLGRAA